MSGTWILILMALAVAAYFLIPSFRQSADTAIASVGSLTLGKGSGALSMEAGQSTSPNAAYSSLNGSPSDTGSSRKSHQAINGGSQSTLWNPSAPAPIPVYSNVATGTNPYGAIGFHPVALEPPTPAPVQSPVGLIPPKGGAIAF